MRRRVRKLIDDLEARVAELEERLEAREWTPVPRNTIEPVDLPELPDYTGGWDDDCDDMWNPTTYL